MQEQQIDCTVVGSPSDLDATLSPLLPYMPRIARHNNVYPWLATFANSPEFKILEVGSRAVCSDSIWKHHVPNCTYTGFDVVSGTNVDIVGDAHRLSSYFEAEEFDIVYSSAVFEHLAMPWIVAEEISKVLSVGGFACIETHFSFGQHELPWHFFQFNKMGLECLFNQCLGFEVIDAGLDNPIVGRFSKEAAPYLAGKPVGGLYCHSSIIAKKIKTVLAPSQHLDWRECLDQVIGSTMYPENTGLSSKT